MDPDRQGTFEEAEGGEHIKSRSRQEPVLTGIPLVRIAGIDVFINRTWFIIFILATWSLATGYFPATVPGHGPLVHWLLGMLAAALLFASVVFHEMAHSLVARHAGLHIAGITLFIFGGVSSLEENPPDPATELKLSLAGPASSLFLAAFFFGLLNVPGLPRSAASLITYLAVVNFLLAAFNLLPGFPLDGGRAFRAVVWWKTGDLSRATYIAAGAGSLFGILLIVLGLFRIATGEFVGGVWLSILGSFLHTAARLSRREAESGVGQEV